MINGIFLDSLTPIHAIERVHVSDMPLVIYTHPILAPKK